MQFLKKHYEKIVLGIVLAGLIGGLVDSCSSTSPADKQTMDAEEVTAFGHLINPVRQALPDLDLATNDTAVAHALLRPHPVWTWKVSTNVFNPFEWIKRPDKRVVKKATSDFAGSRGHQHPAPLYLVSLAGSPSLPTNWVPATDHWRAEAMAAPTPAKRGKQQRFVSLGDKPNDTFSLIDVKGPAENPDALHPQADRFG